MKKILFPTDFSPTAVNAFEYALALAKDLDATIDLMTVYHLPVADASSVPPQYVDTVAWAFDKNRDGHPAFLMGERGDGGWLRYFPIAFAVKTTIPFMTLLIIGTALILIRQPREALYLLVPSGVRTRAEEIAELQGAGGEHA